LVGDSTNVFNTEASGSEGGVRDSLMRLCQNRRGRIVVSTFASNVARLDTLGRVANATGRNVVLVGRSLDRMVKNAKENGYLKDFPQPISLDMAAEARPDTVMVIATGCQGEHQAALSRIARREHSHIKLAEGDLVIFSSKNIPGNELAI